MTSTPQNSSQPRLKVVPPAVPEPAKKLDKPTQPPLEQTPKKSTFPTQWIAWGVVILGLGGIGMIPVNHSISGQTIITSTVGERQSVTMPETGTFDYFWITFANSIRISALSQMRSRLHLDSGIESEAGSAFSRRSTDDL